MEAEENSEKTDKQLSEYTKKMKQAYSKAERFDRSNNFDKRDKYQEVGDNYSELYQRRAREIGKLYANKYKEAVLKDIGYSDIEKGKRMLDEYNIHDTMLFGDSYTFGRRY